MNQEIFKNPFFYVSIVFLIAVSVLAIFYYTQKPDSSVIMDKYGCRTSDGYVWCFSAQKCMQREEYCHVEDYFMEEAVKDLAVTDPDFLETLSGPEFEEYFMSLVRKHQEEKY
jgi:hypothetical protein